MANHWDENAQARHQTLLAGEDVCYKAVTEPTILSLVGEPQDVQPQSLLEVGCGSGLLARKLSSLVASYCGVDPSPRAIELARSFGDSLDNAFSCLTIEAFASSNPTKTYDIVLSTFLLNNLPELSPALAAMNQLLKPGGLTIHAIPHPCFYHQVKTALRDHAEFSYWKRATFAFPLTLHNATSQLPEPVQYTHRPLQDYFAAFLTQGWHVERLLEPYPLAEFATEFSRPWTVPGFLFFLCRKERP